jgi:hypothetical protein
MSVLIQRGLIIVLSVVMVAWSRGYADAAPWTPHYVVFATGVCAAIGVVLVWVPSWLPQAGTASESGIRVLGWLFHGLLWLLLWAQFSTWEARDQREVPPPPDLSPAASDSTRSLP